MEYFSALTTLSPAANATAILETLDLSTLSGNALDNQSAFYLRMTYTSANSQGSQAIDNIQLTGVATSPTASEYLAWIGGYNLGGLTAISDDPDLDGVPNGAEFVLKNGNPEVPNTTWLPTSSSGGNDLVFTFEREDRAKGTGSGVTVTVEAGTDLADWPDTYQVRADTALSTSGVVITHDGDADPDTITVTIPKNGAPAKFARLKVVGTP